MIGDWQVFGIALFASLGTFLYVSYSRQVVACVAVG
jgi:hypothetical protein